VMISEVEGVLPRSGALSLVSFTAAVIWSEIALGYTKFYY